MSDQSQGPGWWVASDGKWYPPETHPDYVPPPPPPGAGPGGPARRRGRRRLVWLVVAAVVVLVGAAVVVGLVQDDDDDGDRAATTQSDERREGRDDPDDDRPSTTTTRREPRQDLTVVAGHTSALNSIDVRYTSAGALVTNPNTTWAAYDVSVIFNLVGPGGEVLDTDTTHVPYIPPAATVPVAPSQLGFDIPTEPAGVQVSLTFDLAEDEGWAGVEFAMQEGIELQATNATIRASRFSNELSFTVTNPSSQVAEFATWDCVLRRGGVIVGGERSGISDPIVPGGSVQAGHSLSVDDLTADEVICRAYG